ncbi:MAG: glycine cleavage system protein GcvH [Myxococcales bacterium]|nr:glycine cleavage system protein GcvH [Myxococcales bacterium]
MADIPTDLHYTKEHEWLRAKDGGFQVGITAFAVEQLGDVTMVELPEIGDTIEKEAVFGTVESVKAVSDLYAPITGSVSRINETLEDMPEAVNETPYAEGWLVEVTPSDDNPLDGLMDAEAYAAFCAGE